MNQDSDARRSKLFLLSVINFFGFLDTNLLIPIMALYASTLGAGPGTIGFLVGLYSITNTPVNILSGRLIDRVGYKLPLVAGLAGSAATMFGYTLTRLPMQLALVRMVHGMFGGLKSPAVMSAFSENAGESGRGRVMAFYGMSLAIANLVGFGLSGIIVSRLGYDPLFLLGVVVLGVGAGIALTLPRVHRPANPVTRPSFRRYFEKVKWLLRRRELQVSFLAIFAQYFAFGGVVTLLPLQLRNLGMEVFHVGMVLAAFTVAFIILQFPSGIISDRLGRRKLINAGLILAIISLLILPLMTTFSTILPVMALYGAAFGLLFPSASALIADNATQEERGTANGIFHALLTAGVGIGAPVLGAVSSLVGIKIGLTFNPAILMVTLGLFLTVMRKK